MATNNIDWSLIINWIVSGLIGAFFGALGIWIAYGFNRKRDDTNWKRQIEQEQNEWKREIKEKERQKIVEQLTQDINNPQIIKNLTDEFRRKNLGLLGELNVVEISQIIQSANQFVIEKLNKEQ